MTPLEHVHFVFFDIGSTLVDEEAAYHHRIMDMIAETDLSFEAVNAKRIEFARQGFDGNAKVISYFGLRKTPWHTEDETLYNDAKDILEYLKMRGYLLGVLANQTPNLTARLQHWGIAEYFSVIASSAELGTAKPGPKIFEMALAMAGCDAVHAVMIGDRLDNDMLPANRCGMQTIWVRRGMAQYQPKHLGEDYVSATVDSLAALKRLL